MNTCGHSPYITPSLTRRWVCLLQLLLPFAIAFILGSESRVTRGHIVPDSGLPFGASYDSQGCGRGIQPTDSEL
jgi:hypothetical protein